MAIYRQEGRFRKFSISEIKKRDYKLDISALPTDDAADRDARADGDYSARSESPRSVSGSHSIVQSGARNIAGKCSKGD